VLLGTCLPADGHSLAHNLAHNLLVYVSATLTACRALSVAAVSCKLTVLSVICAVACAAAGTPVGLLTLGNAVQLLLLRGGVAVGLLVKLTPVLRQLL
jgi:hypothetical protein